MQVIAKTGMEEILILAEAEAYSDVNTIREREGAENISEISALKSIL